MKRTIDNLEILKFMEVKPATTSPGNYSLSDSPFFFTRQDTEEECLRSYAEYAKYDKDWSWLMPVIRGIIKSVGLTTIDEYTTEEWRLITNITNMYIGVDIEQAHHYVVEYVKYFNNK